MKVIPVGELPYSVIAHEFVGEDHGANVTFLMVEAPPGSGPGLHSHPYEEIIITQAGKARFFTPAEEREVRAGEVVVIPAGQPHGFVNCGDTVLKQIDIHVSARFSTTWLTD